MESTPTAREPTSRKTRLNIAISVECKKRIAELANAETRSISQQAEHILNAWYENLNKAHSGKE